MDRRLLLFSRRLLLEDARRRVTLGRGRDELGVLMAVPPRPAPASPPATLREPRAPSEDPPASLHPSASPSLPASPVSPSIFAGIPPSVHPPPHPPPSVHPPIPLPPKLGLTPNPGTFSAFSCPAPRWGWRARGGSCPGCHLRDREGSPLPRSPGARGSGVSPSLCRWGWAKPGELSELGQDLGEGGPANPSWHQASVRGR